MSDDNKQGSQDIQSEKEDGLDLKEEALAMLKDKCSIIPVGIDKKPLIPSWKEFQKRRPEPEEVEKWFKDLNPAGIAIIMGKISGYVVLDIEKEFDDSDLAIPPTRTVRTGGGGKHYYFRYPKNRAVKSINLRPEIIGELKSDGTYVIAPPSLHKSGKRYEWIEGSKASEVKNGQHAYVNYFAELPIWLLGKADKKNPQPNSEKPKIPIEGVVQGERNIAATQVVGSLLSRYQPTEWDEKVWLPAKEWNLKNQPSLSEEELFGVYKSISKARLRQIETDFADEEVENPHGIREVPALRQPQEKTSKEKWDEIIKSNFPELFTVAEIVLGTIGQLLIKDITNPFGIVLVDMPSSGKTIILNFFEQLNELVLGIDNFTPSSFVSHASNRKKSELSKIDLLPQIKDRALLVRDLAPIFGLRDDDLLRNMGILTRVFDGEGLVTASGVHGRRGYPGCYMFVFLAASTPIPPKVWKLMGGLGSRLFFINVGSAEKNEEALADQLLSTVFKEKEAFCRTATANFIRSLWLRYPEGIVWDRNESQRECLVSIARIAKMLARLRGTISVWAVNEKSGEENSVLTHSIPIHEKPDRINQTLYNFARGYAVVNGRLEINDSDIKAVLKIALESAPYHRTQLFKALILAGGEMTSEQVEEFLKCSRPTAHKEMEILVRLDLVNKKLYGSGGEEWEKNSKIKLKNSFEWLLEMRARWPELF